MKLFGQEWSPGALQAHVGAMRTVFGPQRISLGDGRGVGVAAADINTGAGLRYRVLLDRGMSIGDAEFKGVPLAWQSPTGVTGPAYHEREGLGWLRTFQGGLMATCGLTQVGTPCADQGEALGLHGRAGHLPAEAVWVDGEWQADGEYRMWARGKVIEAGGFGPHVVLTRTISSSVGVNRIVFEDRVANLGGNPVPHMMLYHFNLGFPLLREGARVVLPSQGVTPRDGESAVGLHTWTEVTAPRADYHEQVFHHEMAAGPDGYVTAALVNEEGPAGKPLVVYVRYRQAELPRFWQWKYLGVGTYVMGLEPGNCSVMGRAHDRAAGDLESLAPGETREYRVEMGVTDDPDEQRTILALAGLGRK